MISMSIANAIRVTTGQFADNISTTVDHGGLVQASALHFAVVVAAANHGYEKDGKTQHADWVRQFYKEIHFLITREKEVFQLHCDKHTDNILNLDLSLWKNTCSNTSAWKNHIRRELIALEIQAWEYCYTHMPSEHRVQMHSTNVNMTIGNHHDEYVGFYDLTYSSEIKSDKTMDVKSIRSLDKFNISFIRVQD